MIKIVLCCGAGMSSSYLATKMQKEIEEKGMDKEYSIEFFPFGMVHGKAAKEVIEKYDVAILCPHLKYEVPKMIKDAGGIEIPMYILPPKIYANLELGVIIKDVLDVMDRFNTDKVNPVVFPGEENTMRVLRTVAHRDLNK